MKKKIIILSIIFVFIIALFKIYNANKLYIGEYFNDYEAIRTLGFNSHLYKYDRNMDYNKKINYLLKAEDIASVNNLKDPELLSYIGDVYYFEIHDYFKARDYYYKALEQGDLKANYYIGELYLNGNKYDLKQDKKQAIEFFNQIANIKTKVAIENKKISMDNVEKFQFAKGAALLELAKLLYAKDKEESFNYLLKAFGEYTSVASFIGKYYKDKGMFIKAYAWYNVCNHYCLGWNDNTRFYGYRRANELHDLQRELSHEEIQKAKNLSKFLYNSKSFFQLFPDHSLDHLESLYKQEIY